MIVSTVKNYARESRESRKVWNKMKNLKSTNPFHSATRLFMFLIVLNIDILLTVQGVSDLCISWIPKTLNKKTKQTWINVDMLTFTCYCCEVWVVKMYTRFPSIETGKRCGQHGQYRKKFPEQYYESGGQWWHAANTELLKIILRVLWKLRRFHQKCYNIYYLLLKVFLLTVYIFNFFEQCSTLSSFSLKIKLKLACCFNFTTLKLLALRILFKISKSRLLLWSVYTINVAQSDLCDFILIPYLYFYARSVVLFK